MNKLVVDNVQRSFGRCTLAGDFLSDFYDLFMKSDPEIRMRFKDTDMDTQRSLLKNGLTFMIMFASGQQSGKNKLDRLAKSHGREGMQIPSWMYAHWKDALLESVRKNDPKADDRLMKEWGEVMQLGINRIGGML